MPAESTSARRHAFVDIARGSAIALMFVYHFSFDLVYFGVVAFDFNNDLRWLGFRAAIVAIQTWLCHDNSIGPIHK